MPCFKYLKLLVPINNVILIVNKLKGDSSHLFLAPIVKVRWTTLQVACFFISVIRWALSGWFTWDKQKNSTLCSRELPAKGTSSPPWKVYTVLGRGIPGLTPTRSRVSTAAACLRHAGQVDGFTSLMPLLCTLAGLAKCIPTLQSCLPLTE